MQYSLSYLIASSMGGSSASAETGAAEPIDMVVGLNIDLKEYPQVQGAAQSSTTEDNKAKEQVKPVKFSTTRDKFLQFSKDMKGALTLLEA